MKIIWKIPASMMQAVNPMKVIEACEAVSASQAYQSLAMGISDTVVMAKEFNTSEIEEFDRLFVSDGLPSLSSMQLLHSKLLAKIFKKDEVTNDDEFYLLKALEDSSALDSKTKLKIIDLLHRYEDKVGIAARIPN